MQQPDTIEDFHTWLNEYLQWWNSTRIQERLSYLSPDEYLARHRVTFN
ncbi:IS3 family transposase [Arthrobacter burdickii]